MASTAKDIGRPEDTNGYESSQVISPNFRPSLVAATIHNQRLVDPMRAMVLVSLIETVNLSRKLYPHSLWMSIINSYHLLELPLPLSISQDLASRTTLGQEKEKEDIYELDPVTSSTSCFTVLYSQNL
ncbi:uncharacterized protein LOC116262289 [Nymphaea colorata]|nr:uncharacterized protein LOC116262289 [Nymphaea colorata]